jgi:hypothetical protein
MSWDPGDQQSIRDAWANLKGKWLSGMATAAISTPLNALSFSAQLNQVCNQLNQSSDPFDPGGTWVADGNATVTVTGLKITAFEGASLANVEFPDKEGSVVLPLAFTRFEVSGQYSYRQSCEFATLFRGPSQDVHGSGQLTQTASNGRLAYQATYKSRQLSLDKAIVTGSISTRVAIGSGDGGVRGMLENIFGAGERWAVTRASDVFATGAFSAEMIQLLNQKLAS